MVKKHIFLSLGIAAIAAITVATGAAAINEGKLTNVNAEKDYVLTFTADDFKNANIVSSDGNKITFAYSNGKYEAATDGLVALKQGVSFKNETKISGISKIYAEFTGEINFDTGFDTVAGKDTTEVFLAHTGSTLTSKQDYGFAADARPSFVTFNATKDTVIKSLSIHYSCQEVTVPEKFTHEWYVVGKFGGVESWNDLTKATKLTYDPQGDTSFAQFKATVELNAGEIFKVRDAGNTWHGISKVDASLKGKDGIVSGSDNITANAKGTYTIYFRGDKTIFIDFVPSKIVTEYHLHAGTKDVKLEINPGNPAEFMLLDVTFKKGETFAIALYEDNVRKNNIKPKDGLLTDPNFIECLSVDAENVFTVKCDCKVSFYASSAGVWANAGKIIEVNPDLKIPSKFYLVVNAHWLEANARFAAYFFQEGGESIWVDMTAVEGKTNTYVCDKPEITFTTVIFCRMNPGTTENIWDNKWSQTGNLEVTEKDQFTLKADSWDQGTWSTFVA